MTHDKRPTLPVLAAAAAAALACATFCASAEATPEFPGTIDSDLALTKTVEATFPPDGCLLCHTTESGGLNQFKPFGTLVHQYGASAYNPNSLKAALTAIQGTTPQLLDDLKAGRDPNLDDSAGPTLPSPQYGCSVASSAAPVEVGPLGALAGAVLAMLATARRRRRAKA
jgi:MYXO-CTERM domain-containing protein